MKRRTALWLLAGSLGLGAAAGTGAFVFRLHSTPRRTPFLTAEHLEGLLPDNLDRPRVLFIGNSMILRHDVPALVAALAASEGRTLSVATAAADGARLVETIRLPELERILQPGIWDAIVLQDFTKTPLRATDRLGSLTAMNWIGARTLPTPIVLYPPWPAAEGNPVYRDAGPLTATPRDPVDYAARTMDFYTDVAVKAGFYLAPVPEAWLEATNSGEMLYHEDGHHSNERGAKLAAEVLWSMLAKAL